MGRRLVGLSVLLIAGVSLSPAQSATLMNNAIRISPALQFHTVAPSVAFSEKHSLSDIHVTKPIDVATPKLMTRKRSLHDIHITKHTDKATPKLMMETVPSPPTTPVPIPYPNISAQQ